MIDKTFDPWPKRAHRRGRPASDSKFWFGRETGWSAEHYCDLTWMAVLMPAFLGLGLLAVSTVLPGTDFPAFLRLVSAGLVLFGAHRGLMRLIAAMRGAD